MIIENDIKLDFKDVLIRPKRSKLKSRSDVNLSREFIFKHVPDYKWCDNTIPIMVSNMDTTGTFKMAKEVMKLNIFTCIHKYYNLSDWLEFIKGEDLDINWNKYIAISSGSQKHDIDKLYTILDMVSDIKFICLDVANGYTENFANIVNDVRNKYPNKIIIAGNVVTREMTEELILKGADIVKVGIGPGSVCTTRIKTGVGYPQLSAIIECADAAHGLKAHIIADGGCTCSGDISKAFGGGADFVMAGGLFSGHDECEGEIILMNNIKYKRFYGMSSSTAMEKHSGGVSNYKSSEGKEVLVKYKGEIKRTILDLLGGIRSTCTYVGTNELKYLSKCTTFIKVTQQYNNIFS